MINGLEGIPGSGKSYEAVVYHVLPMLQSGRKVITNLPLVVDMFAAIDPAFTQLIELRRRPKPVLGVWNADAMDDDGNGNAFALFSQSDPAFSDLVHSVDLQNRPGQSVSVFGHVWDYYSDWKHPKTGQGPVIIIDECHLALPVTGTDPQVVEFFKLHRHFNVDILLMTQSFRDINQPIARLQAMLIKCRKADILGKNNEYIRKVHAGYRGAVISTEVRPYKPQYFPLYKSHTQGNSVAESGALDVAPLSVKLRRFTWAFWIAAACFIAWMYWPKAKITKPLQAPASTQQTDNVPPPSRTPSTDNPATRAKPVSAIRQASANAKDDDDEDPENPEPYGSKILHLTGRITMRGEDIYTFSVSMNGQRISTLDSRDLKKLGYKWTPFTDCAGMLRWNGKPKPITCDAPLLAQGTQDRPVVIDTGNPRAFRPAAATAYPPSGAPLPAAIPDQQKNITQWSQGLIAKNAQAKSENQ